MITPSIGRRTSNQKLTMRRINAATRVSNNDESCESRNVVMMTLLMISFDVATALSPVSITPEKSSSTSTCS